MNKMLQFFSENKDALTSIGILLTFLISSISLYFSVRNNKAVHYVNAVTQNRVEWLYKFREYISDLISTTTIDNVDKGMNCLLYTSPSPRDAHESRMPSSA